MGTVKAGWLQKLSGFFKNTWKKRYFVLYQSGDFCYYQDPQDKDVDGRINMKLECRNVAVGHAVGEGVKAPKDIDALFSVVSTERTWYLVAESAGDASEWVSALQQTRTPVSYPSSSVQTGPPVSQPGSYGYGYPRAAAPAGPPPPYSQVPPGAAPPYLSQPPMPQPAAAYPPPQYPPQGYPQQPYPQPRYPQQPYPQPPPGAYAPPVQGYAAAPPPGQYPRQQYNPGTTTYVQGAQPQTVYVQKPSSSHTSSRNKMMMGAGAGALGGAAVGYMLGRATGGGYGHGFGGWDSDHSWSSGGSFDCDFD